MGTNLGRPESARAFKLLLDKVVEDVDFFARTQRELEGGLSSRLAVKLKVPHSAHYSSGIVPVDGALLRVACATNIALSAKKNGVNERLRAVEIIEEEEGGANETKEDSEVVCDEHV